MILRPHLLTCLFALALVAFVAPAQAQDPQVDPGSPAGTEYQLPIERARDEAGGTSDAPSGSRGSTGGEAPLFGAGVERETETPSKKDTKSGTDSDPATVTGVKPDAGTATPETVRAQAPAPDGSGSGLVAIAGGAAGVLILGALAGSVWRRRSTRA